MNKFNLSLFGKNLKKLIESRNVNLVFIAEETGLTTATLSRYLTCSRMPKIDKVYALAELFDVPIDWLVGRSYNRTNNLSSEDRHLIDLYNLASPDDRTVIQAILNRYKEVQNNDT